MEGNSQQYPCQDNGSRCHRPHYAACISDREINFVKLPRSAVGSHFRLAWQELRESPVPRPSQDRRLLLLYPCNFQAADSTRYLYRSVQREYLEQAVVLRTNRHKSNMGPGDLIQDIDRATHIIEQDQITSKEERARLLASARRLVSSLESTEDEAWRIIMGVSS